MWKLIIGFIVLAAITFIIGVLFVKETKDVDIYATD